MKASVMNRYGGPEVLVYGDLSDPRPGPGEVLIRTAAASVNPVDLLQRSGATKEYLPVTFPGTIGWDIAGTVTEVGSGVTDFAVGDRVMAWAFATYAEMCAVKASIMIRLPDEIDPVSAAAFPLVTTTGSQLISVGSGVQNGQTVLVSGAVGGVARAAICTAKEMGARVIAGVRQTQFEEAELTGADEVVAIDQSKEFAKLPKVDIVANTVRGQTARQLMTKVKDGGTFASVTDKPGNEADFPAVRVVSFVSKQNAETLRRMVIAVRERRLSIPVYKNMPLAQAREAHEAVQAGVPGKVLLIP